MRENFTDQTKRELADRVGHHCSNPECRALTTGPRIDETKSLNIGVAAHITAASSGGPRYDSALSREQRQSANNAVWLCHNCGKLVDNDVERYSLTILQSWKKQAENEASKEIGKTLNSFEPSEAIAKSRPIPLDRLSLSGYIGGSRRVRELDQRMTEDAGLTLEQCDSDLCYLVERAEYFGIENLAQLDDKVIEFGEQAIRLSHYLRVKTGFMQGFSLAFVFEIMAARLGSIDQYAAYQESLKRTFAERSWAEEMMKIYEQIALYP